MVLRSPGHPYEAIGGDTHCGVLGRRLADTSRRGRGLLQAAFPCGAVFCLVGSWMAVRSNNTAPGLTQGRLYDLGGRSQTAGTKEGADADVVMQVLVTNKYQRYNESAGLMYPWEHVAEPVRDTRLEILSWPGRNDGAGLDFIWHVRAEVVGKGEAISTVFSSPGAYECSVTASLPPDEGEDGGDGEESEEWLGNQGEQRAPAEPAHRAPSVLRSGRAGGAGATVDAIADEASPENKLDFVVTVKYVRREIRALTDRDRETFFNAVSVMQRVPTAVGREVYGSKYYSKDYFTRMHIYGGGRNACDRWHDGAGFVTSHVAVSLMYEQSLQAINPAITLPYWDFTIEGTFYDWSNFRTSSVFSDDWFGNAAPQNAMRTPARGRFGYVPNMVNATEYSGVYNSYGMLRSPWNSDPTPFLTRSDILMGFVNDEKPSGCRKYRDAMMQRSWMALTEAFNDGAHGEIHELLGGSWSRNVTAYADRTDPIVQPFAHRAVVLLKLVWRAGYLGCPDTCAMDVPWEQCACTCTETTLKGLSSWEALQDAGVLGGSFYDKDFVLIDSLLDEEGNAYEVIPGYTKEETEDIYDEMLSTLCLPMRLGTHYGATSTNDPTFFLIHPTFDRLWHLQRLEASDGFNETWVSDHSCYGHNPEDNSPFHDLFPGDTDAPTREDGKPPKVEPAKQYYTNQELKAKFKPDGMDSPYIYDNFEWSHCDEQGVFIRGH